MKIRHRLNQKVNSGYIQWVFLSTLVLVTLILWFPTITIPYWWDSAIFVIPTAKKLLDTNFWPLTSGFTDFAHPTLFIVLLALVWKIFGESLFASHVVNLAFTLIAVIYIYRLGKALIADNPAFGNFIGFLSSLLFLFTPPVLAQMGIIYLEIPVTAFALMSYFYFLTGKHTCWLLATIAMVLTKEPSAVIVALYILSEGVSLWRYRHQKQPALQRGSKLLLRILPLIVLSLWYLYHFLVSGWWVVKPGRPVATITLMRALDYTTLVFHYIFIDQMRFYLLSVYAALAFFIFSEQGMMRKYLRFWDEKRIILLLIPLVFTLLFGSTEFLWRYAVLVFPFLYLLFFYNTYIFFTLVDSRSRYAYGIVGVTSVVLLFLFYSQWDEHRRIEYSYYTPIEDNLEYLNIIDLGRATYSYIEKHYPHARVYTAFPNTYMYSQPIMHYVTTPLQTFDCKSYKKGDRVDVVDVVVYHTYSPNAPYCGAIVLNNNWDKNHQVVFEGNGKMMIVATP